MVVHQVCSGLGVYFCAFGCRSSSLILANQCTLSCKLERGVDFLCSMGLQLGVWLRGAAVSRWCCEVVRLLWLSFPESLLPVLRGAPSLVYVLVLVWVRIFLISGDVYSILFLIWFLGCVSWLSVFGVLGPRNSTDLLAFLCGS